MNPDAKQYTFLEEKNCLGMKTLLQQYIAQIPWPPSVDGELVHIADAGCGSGRVTKEALLACIPGNGDRDRIRITAFDLSEYMIRVARERHPDPRIEFVVAKLDDRRTFPAEWHGRFCKVFSHYCIHWLRDLRAGIHNLSGILRPGGILFAVILLKSPLFEVSKKLMKSGKWQSYCTAPLPELVKLNPESREQLLRDAFQEAGFQMSVFQTISIHSDLENLDLFKELLRSIGLFYTDIPEDLKEAYVHEYAREMLGEGMEEGNYIFTGTKLVVIATKTA